MFPHLEYWHTILTSNPSQNGKTTPNYSKIKSFLCHTGFYQRLIRNFPDVAYALYRLLCKNSSCVWNDEAESAFSTLKPRLLSIPALSRPDSSRKSIFHCDPSDVDVRAVISKFDDKQCLIPFFPKQDTPLIRKKVIQMLPIRSEI
ncbi:hypothetical protein RF11_03391 [Thelohanellus kitauei]|uniref:Reverse transcriptase/retrotransposon-derived protein RNase H-like domain-containing protein n=1 Tax=Thelohanellus kitauei TaxID=669202 RepID=A0A0C2MCG1_THEKT|nr:hypothetical protein RF11_03391 [Thelohanellus kitauei]